MKGLENHADGNGETVELFLNTCLSLSGSVLNNYARRMGQRPRHDSRLLEQLRRCFPGQRKSGDGEK